MAQVITKFITDNAVDDKKVRLPNGNFLRGRNQAGNADISILKINGSDRVEFGSIPQYPASSPSPSLANDIVNKFYVDTAIAANVSKYYRTPVMVVDAVSTTLPTGGTQLDGITIANGDRVLFTNQTISGNNNRVYVVTVTTGVISAYTIAIDNDPTGAPRTGDTLWVQAGTYAKHQLTYNGTAFVVTGTDVGVSDGDCINVTSLGQINIDLQTAGGLYSSSPGNQGGQLGIKITATNPTLIVDGSNQLGVKFSVTTSGLQTSASGLQIQLQASNPTLAIDGSNQLGVKFSATASGLQAVAAGLAVKLQASNPTLSIDGSSQLGVKYALLSGLTANVGGLLVSTDTTTDATVAIDSVTGEIRTPREKFEVITLNGTNITNQYVDLQRLSQLNSVTVTVYGVEQTSGVDYTLSTQGGVTRVTFSGDLATGGNAALISGDVVYIRYRSYTA